MEEKCSKIRLWEVDGYLAFHQGWNIFVSYHLIKWGEFLLFEYTANSIFSVRVLSKDSLERLHFNVESKRKGVRKKQTWSNMSPDDLISFDGNSEDIDDDHYLSGEYPRGKDPITHHVTVEGPKKVERGVGSGPEALVKKNENLVNRQYKTKGISPLRGQEKTKVKHVLELHDSNEDLRTKQEIDSIHLEPTTAAERYYNNSKTNISQNIYRKYEAPEGFLCLEKWRNEGIVSGRAALDDTGLIKPKNPTKKLIANW
ncbi:B3 domain-containing protein Os02g0598200-like [Phragmites australis]|uniref:B3 domain-containing protein Os02g0598200-like n=1 Tax=Phragmites australis TaxID=29695 RepID=UPI002D794092|nr:B3 domain-containing protein Os02g0598200-like [Phragmites australis]